MSQYEYSFGSGASGRPGITWATQRLILANVIVFALQLVSDPLFKSAGVHSPYFGGGFGLWFGFYQPAFLQGFVWTPFTYQFLHSTLLHLFLNMLWLFFFGPDVERVLGTRNFFRFYLICGAGGVLATFIPYFVNGSATNVVGASGAVMGVLVAFALIEPDRQVFLFPFPWPLNARALVMIVVVMNIITALSAAPVSVMTHFGGMVMGFLYMKSLPLILNFQRNRRRRASEAKKKTKPSEKVGEAVDNIFKFDDRKRR